MKEVDKDFKEFIKNQPITFTPIERSLEYYKGYHDAVGEFMRIFDKLINSGALNGTKPSNYY